MKEYKKKDVMSDAWNAGVKYLEFTENGKKKLILFFMLNLVWRMIRADDVAYFCKKVQS